MTAPLTHEQRLEVINRPFFITRIDRSYPWAVTITTNQFDRTVDDLIAEQLEAEIRREMLLYLLQTEVERFGLVDATGDATINAGWFGAQREEIRRNIEDAFDAGWSRRETEQHYGYPSALVNALRGVISRQRRAAIRRQVRREAEAA